MIRLLTEHFISARINSDERPDLARQYGLFWNPTLVTLHHLGHQLRQTIGYLPPEDMYAELILTRGLYALRSARAAAAEALFQMVVADHGETQTAPEAMYWQGVAAYRRTKDKENLWIVWRELIATYPDTIWSAKTTLASEEGRSSPDNEPRSQGRSSL